jgi:hypothetical protein
VEGHLLEPISPSGIEAANEAQSCTKAPGLLTAGIRGPQPGKLRTPSSKRPREASKLSRITFLF